MDDWKDAFIAGLGGGALYGIVDGFLTNFLGTTPLAGTAITLKDIATILLSKLAADRTSGMLQTAFKGAVVIGIYKVVYPQFVEPLIKGFLPSTGGETVTTTESSALERAQAYVYAQGGG